MIAVLKPTYLCNLRCTYCYLPEQQKSKRHKWSLPFAKKIIQDLVDYSRNSQQDLVIIWHGGEPLLWGEENFEEILDFIAEKSSYESIGIRNIIQTNLTLITPKYIEIFKKHNAKISFSIDGPQKINDLTRCNKNGDGTYHHIKKNIDMCIDNGIKLSCVVVGNKNHIGNINELYSFMNSLGVDSFKLNPIFDNGESSYDSLGINGDDYADMLIELFDIWYSDENAKVSETNLVEICSNILTKKPRACHFKQNCQREIIAISPEGEVCPCGRFCEDSEKFSYGNIVDNTLEEILLRQRSSKLSNRSTVLFNGECSGCKYWSICHGGCPHDALSYSHNYLNKTFLCSAYKRLFAHISSKISNE